MTFTKTDLALIDMALLKMIGELRMELILDSYLFDEGNIIEQRKIKIAEAFEKIEQKVLSLKNELEMEDLK